MSNVDLHAQLLALSNRFRRTLAAAMEARPQRQDIVETATGPELEWVLYERGVMHREVNHARVERGLLEVSVGAVERVERLAVGHSDYHQKFAFGCAEIVLNPLLARRTDS